MNRRLVMCLFAAMLVGLAAAAWALSAGWHPLVALAIYSLSGSCSLVAFTLLLAARRAHPPAAARDHPLPAAQST